MSLINKISLAITSTLLLFALATPVSATTLTVTNVTLPSGTPFNLTITGGYFGSTTRAISSPYAGQIMLQTKELGAIGTWCVDDLHTIYLGGTYSYTTGLLKTDSSGSTLAGSNNLSSQQIHDVMALATYGNQVLAGMASGINHDILSGEVQAAIWSVIYGASVTASGSDVSGVSALTFNNGAQSLKTLAPTLATGPAVALYNLATNGSILSQSLIASSTELARLVPEPNALALMSIALAAGATLRKRRNSN
ncbi:MAG: PEP-CTERM sorting domain-containing protein [Methylovulum sp.]|nr:PEP-CTERM sorting domain-containing protein [Methylovulum sp.]